MQYIGINQDGEKIWDTQDGRDRRTTDGRLLGWRRRQSAGAPYTDSRYLTISELEAANTSAGPAKVAAIR